MVNVLTLSSCLVEVLHAGALTKNGVSNLWKLSVDIESEGTESSNVNAFSSTELLVQVSDEAPPDDEHLSLGFKGSLSLNGPFSWNVMLTRVLISILKNPIMIVKLRFEN